MIRLYTDNFYKTPGLQSQYEKAYQDLFYINFNNTNKYVEMVNTCTIYLPKLQNQCNIQNFPITFNELIILQPNKIAEIFEFYINRINPIFNKILDDAFHPQQIDKKGNPKVNSKGQPVCRFILDYTYRKYSEKIADFFIQNDQKGFYNINTCYYCNMSYINIFEYVKKKDKTIQKRQTYDLDHFIPKSVCSLFALCLYNLVPSCKVCNQLKSDDINFYNLSAQELEKLFPTSQKYDYEKSLKFRIKQKNSNNFPPFSFLKDKNGNDIRDEFEIKFENNQYLNNYYSKEAEPFFILERYTPHKNEFLNYMEKHLKYPQSFFSMLSNSLSPQIQGQLQDDIFNINLRTTARMIFFKIYNDLDEQF